MKINNECEICKGNNFDFNDGLIICSNYCSSYILEYTGCFPYDDGGEQFFSSGFEPKEWLEKYKNGR